MPRSEELINDQELEEAIKRCQKRYGTSANLTLARIVAIRIKRLYDDPDRVDSFGLLMRRALNELEVSPKEERRKYSRVAAEYFRRHAIFVIKNGRRRARRARNTTARPVVKNRERQLGLDV